MELNVTEIEDIPENKPVSKVQVSKVQVSKVQALKVVKKQENQPIVKPQQPPQQQTVKSSLHGVKARMVRPQTPATKPNVSYDDILAKMGMYLDNGKLRLISNKNATSNATTTATTATTTATTAIKKQVHFQEETVNKSPRPIPQATNIKQPPTVPLEQKNSYIYQKYFKNEPVEEQEFRQPQTIQEYRNLLISDIIQKYKIKQIKSNKLIMPTSNINFAQGGSGNLNKLFSFSQR
jgi:hypothetical protein